MICSHFLFLTACSRTKPDHNRKFTKHWNEKFRLPGEKAWKCDQVLTHMSGRSECCVSERISWRLLECPLPERKRYKLQRSVGRCWRRAQRDRARWPRSPAERRSPAGYPRCPGSRRRRAWRRVQRRSASPCSWRSLSLSWSGLCAWACGGGGAEGGRVSVRRRMGEQEEEQVWVLERKAFLCSQPAPPQRCCTAPGRHPGTAGSPSARRRPGSRSPAGHFGRRWSSSCSGRCCQHCSDCGGPWPGSDRSSRLPSPLLQPAARLLPAGARGWCAALAGPCRVSPPQTRSRPTALTTPTARPDWLPFRSGSTGYLLRYWSAWLFPVSASQRNRHRAITQLLALKTFEIKQHKMWSSESHRRIGKMAPGFTSCRSVWKCQQLNRKKPGPRLLPTILDSNCFLATLVHCNRLLYLLIRKQHGWGEMKTRTDQDCFLFKRQPTWHVH